MKSKNILIVVGMITLAVIVIILINLLNLGTSTKNKTAENGPKEYLEEEELKQFEEYFNQKENNGFLLSEYSNAQEIDLNQVIYSGAGIDKKMTEKEEQEFKKEKGVNDIYVNITTVGQEDIENLFLEKTGEQLQNIETKLKDWTYLKNSKVYCLAHGDTNYAKIDSATLGVKEPYI